MAKKLLSPELSQVLKDIENTREAINEKYAMIGHPSPIPAPLISHDMADAVRAITSLGDLPELDGTIELTYNEKKKELTGGYYKDGVIAKLKDYAVSYIWNRQGLPAKTQYVNVDESFTIPDFGITKIGGEEFKGWSHMPNDEDPEYLTGDVVNHFQYEPRLEDPQYISYLYAVWELLKLDPIELFFEYANGGKLNDAGKEIVVMKVAGQDIYSPQLMKREYEVEGNPPAREDIEIGSNYYKHEFTFNEIGIYPVVVTHTSKNEKEEQQIATGVIKVMGNDGSMRGNGAMIILTNYGSWYDSGWIGSHAIKGCYINRFRFYIQLPEHLGLYSHSSTQDSLAIFGKKTNGDIIILYDFGSNANIGKKVDITGIGTTSMQIKSDSKELTFPPVTLTQGNLSHAPVHHDIIRTYTKSDDIRQLRFFVYSNHDYDCGFSSADIDYDIDYKFDYDLWKSDKINNVGDNNTPGGDGGGSDPNAPEPVDMRLKSFSISPGTLSPAFDKDTYLYTLTVPYGTTSVSFNGSVIDERAEYTINGENINNLNLIKSDGSIITRLEIIVSVKPAYSSVPVVNPGIYVIDITDGTPVSPTPPALTEGNYSYENPNNCLSQRWGYHEMSKFSNGEEYLELYRRIYNAIKYGDTKSTCDYQEYGTTNIKTQNPAVMNNINIGANHTISAILVPFYDLSLDGNQAEYVYKCVCLDCPEIMWRFSSFEDKADNNSDVFASGEIGGRNYLIIPYYPSSIKNNYLNVCESTFQEICTIIQNTYGITFQDDTFVNNNAHYTDEEKKKIGKVIHDYLVLNNVYGFVEARDGLNQTMYPALSKGAFHPVCASYAQAFQYCCWRWGIHCVCVDGGCGNGRDARHQWNLVCYKTGSISTFDGVGSAWQEVDCTWDDPYGQNGNNTNPAACSWKYFNVTTSDLESDQPTIDYVNFVKSLGGSFPGGDPSATPRTRFFTKYPIIANTDTEVNIEHYIGYPADGTCTDNRYDFFDNTNDIPISQFNGQVYGGF